MYLLAYGKIHEVSSLHLVFAFNASQVHRLKHALHWRSLAQILLSLIPQFVRFPVLKTVALTPRVGCFLQWLLSFSFLFLIYTHPVTPFDAVRSITHTVEKKSIVK